MKPVTDPNILMQLNGEQQQGRRPVSDPRILMQLEGVPEDAANLLGDERSVWDTSGASQLPAIREQVMGGRPLAQAVAAQPPVHGMAKPKPPAQLSNSDYLTGLMGQAAQGLTLGFFDEGLAAGASALGINDYQENLRRIRGLDKQFVDENPVTSFAANVVGGIPLGGPLTKAGTGLLSAVAPNAARAVGAGTATAGQRVASGLATGAAAGTVAGAGAAEGGLSDTAYGAATGGLLGAGLGGAIPVATSAASGLGSAALRAMPFLRDINVAGYRPFTSADDRANQLIGQAMARGGDQGAAEAAMSGAVRAQLQSRPAVADTVLGDVSPELRSLTGAVLRSPGTGAAKAREFIATRQEGIPLAKVPGQGSRLADEVSAVGGKINLRDTLDTIVEQRAAAAKPLFEQAFQVGNIINPTLSRIAQDGSVRRALAKGVVLGKRAGDIPPEYKLVIGDTVEAIPARVWHYAKMALDDQISSLRQDGKGAEARSATILKANLVNGIDEGTGGAYRPALQDFAGRSALLDAAEQGQKSIASNVGPDDIQRTMAGFQTQSERDLFSQAYKSSLANMMASASRTTNAASKALLTDQQVAKIRAAFPADQADEIIRRASVRDAQFKTYAETKGSQTQARQMAERDIEDSIQSGINLAGAAANPKGYMIGRAMEWLSNVPARAMSEKVRNALAERLVNPDPQKVATALRAVDAAARREAARGKTVTGNRQFMARNAAATNAMGTLGPALESALNSDPRNPR